MSSSSCLRLAVENGEADEADDGDDETERGAVHGFGDAFGEDARLLARVDATRRRRRRSS